MLIYSFLFLKFITIKIKRESYKNKYIKESPIMKLKIHTIKLLSALTILCLLPVNAQEPYEKAQKEIADFLNDYKKDVEQQIILTTQLDYDESEMVTVKQEITTAGQKMKDKLNTLMISLDSKQQNPLYMQKFYFTVNDIPLELQRCTTNNYPSMQHFLDHLAYLALRLDNQINRALTHNTLTFTLKSLIQPTETEYRRLKEDAETTMTSIKKSLNNAHIIAQKLSSTNNSSRMYQNIVDIENDISLIEKAIGLLHLSLLPYNEIPVMARLIINDLQPGFEPLFKEVRKASNEILKHEKIDANSKAITIALGKAKTVIKKSIEKEKRALTQQIKKSQKIKALEQKKIEPQPYIPFQQDQSLELEDVEEELSSLEGSEGGLSEEELAKVEQQLLQTEKIKPGSDLGGYTTFQEGTDADKYTHTLFELEDTNGD